MNSLRKEIESDIYRIYDDLDQSGENTERVRSFFAEMDDKKFFKYVEEFYSNPDKNYTCAYHPYDNPVTCDFVTAICKKYGIPLYEYLYEPYLNENTEDPPRTQYKILVLDIPIKRLKQMVQTGTHVSIDPTNVDAKTGQVTGHDKVARTTTPELYSLIVQNQYNAAKEQYGPLGDNQKAFYEMSRIIQRDGEVSLEDLPDDPIDKVALNTVNYYLIGSGLKTNLLDATGYLLPITQKGLDENKKSIKR